MRVAIDARELVGKPTGVGRYLRELLREWGQSTDARRHEWMLYAPSPPDVPGAFAGQVRLLAGSGGTAWEQWTLARALATDRPDLLFAPGYTAPLTAPCPIAVAIHDVSFAARPEWFTTREGTRRRAITRWTARRARRILTISEFSRREIVEHLAVPADRVRVIYLGIRAPAAQAAVPREPIVLYVGSIFARRHVDVLVEAFVRHVGPALSDARLEVVGENRLPGGVPVDHALTAAPEGVRARVRFRSYVDETTLRDLYQRALVFAFLSEYEGFGFTPLEAMAHGVAPVVLDTPVAREVYGDAVRHVALGPGTPDELGRALVDLLSRADARHQLLSKAPAVLARYDWTRTAADTLAALEEAAGAR
ncbi:MAG: glycosyltransferase family 4 protein [Acidobacteriota bacterium]|nr:glycosyltransferase family 4 protein [Acidobacteriota bacterium]